LLLPAWLLPLLLAAARLLPGLLLARLPLPRRRRGHVKLDVHEVGGLRLAAVDARQLATHELAVGGVVALDGDEHRAGAGGRGGRCAAAAAAGGGAAARRRGGAGWGAAPGSGCSRLRSNGAAGGPVMMLASLAPFAGRCTRGEGGRWGSIGGDRRLCSDSIAKKARPPTA
jgi:hypothetical protein